jgi:hypothetical protein
MTIITVTAADIAPHSHHCSKCPTALAIARVVRPGILVSVGPDFCDLVSEDGGIVSLELPKGQIARILRFDCIEEMEPHAFELDIPAEFLA